MEGSSATPILISPIKRLLFHAFNYVLLNYIPMAHDMKYNTMLTTVIFFLYQLLATENIDYILGFFFLFSFTYAWKVW